MVKPGALLILFFLTTLPIGAQSIEISGNVVNSEGEPLSFANLIAKPQNDEFEISFAISDTDGYYRLKLEAGQIYELTVSYLGFKPQKITISSDTNAKRDFELLDNPDQLEEVVIDYKPPVTVKKDTITYRTDAFATGEERKLREVLKKLPGVEVDRSGNVSVQGKRVTKVLVESKTFFTGDSKLAVNNIPADAVSEIEILDNYNEVAMLKGLQDSEDMAMNIKLKEGKKKFAFGDVEAGTGVKERFLVHPNIFYYSPKTNLNFIGDLNNIGVRSFTFRDYIDFEGGFGKLIDDAGSYFDLYFSDFAQFLANQDYRENTSQFAAINITQALGDKTDLSGYAISTKNKTETLSEALNQYVNIDSSFQEERTNGNFLNNRFTLAKLSLNHNPNIGEDLAVNSFLKVTDNQNRGKITTINPNQNNSINTIFQLDAVNFKQNLSYSRKLTDNHTATLEMTYDFQDDKPFTKWLTNQEILQGLIPLESDDIFDIQQSKRLESQNANAIIKDYWVINNSNHIYISAGFNFLSNDFFSRDLQQLSNGTINDFTDAGFGNDFDYNFSDLFLGLEYKFQIGIATFKPALFFHWYRWNTKQFNNEQQFNKALLLPQFTSKIELSNSEKITLRYGLNARFPLATQLANNFILNNFNSVFRGNETLENQLYHSASLNYYKFSLFRQLNLNANLNFNKRLKQIKNQTQLEGIEQFNSPVMFDRPEHNISFSTTVSKKINKTRFKFRSSLSYSDFFQIVNTETDLNISKSISTTISLETTFKNWPNVEIGYSKDFSNFKSSGLTNNFENDRFFLFIEYDFFRDFIFKADYSFDRYQNEANNINNTFDTANASLFYQKENSPWGFEIRASNIFDVNFKQRNSFNAFIIQDQQTFILPRILLFTLSYKL